MYIDNNEKLSFSNICEDKSCNRLKNKEKYCDKHYIINHETKKNHDKYKKVWHKLYYTNTWKRLRIKVLSTNPICAECDQLAQEVDHIVDHKGDRNVFSNLSNLQALCKSCHSSKTMEDIRISNFPNVESVVEITITEEDADVERTMRVLHTTELNKYTIDSTIKGNGSGKFMLKNTKQLRLFERRYKLLHKEKPVFKVIKKYNGKQKE